MYFKDITTRADLPAINLKIMKCYKYFNIEEVKI